MVQAVCLPIESPRISVNCAYEFLTNVQAVCLPIESPRVSVNCTYEF